MKIIGMVGGTGWISTIEYYRLLNEEIHNRLGGMQAAKCILYSLNYAEIDTYNNSGNIEGVYALIANATKNLIVAGADCLVLCANTTHRFVDNLQKEFTIPIVHIAEATAKEIKRFGLKKVGLLGTKQTMELDFYKNKLSEYQIETLIPEPEERNFIQAKINHELIQSVFKEQTKEKFIKIIENLIKKGAEGIILGCTEIPLLIKPQDINIPLFNTLNLHVKAAVDFALQ